MTDVPHTAQNNPPGLPAKPKKLWFRRIVVGLATIVVLLVLLVLLIPTLLSTGWAKSIILSNVSPLVLGHPNAKLDVKSLSLGWFSGQSIEGIRITDADQIVALDASVKTDLSIWSAARGNLNLGNTVIDVDIVRLKLSSDGSSNLHRTFVQPAASKPASGDSSNQTPTAMPNVKGKLVLNITGTIEPPDVGGRPVAPIKIERGSYVVVDLNDTEKNIPLEGKLVYQTQGKTSTVDFKADVDAIQNGLVETDPAKITASGKVNLSDIDLSVLNAVLAPLGVPVNRVEGLVNGSTTLDLKLGLDGTLVSDIVAKNVVVDMPALNGDVISMNEVKLPANVRRQGENIVIDNTGIVSPLGTVNVSGEVPQTALMNLAAGKAPGSSGRIKIATSNVNLATIAEQLPKTMRLLPDVRITSGAFENTLDIDIRADAVAVGQLTKLTGVKGEAGDGKSVRQIALDDTTLQASAVIPATSGTLDTRNLSDMSIDLVSPFAMLKGGGSFDALTFAGESDLDKLQAQLSQFVDLGDVKLAGKADLAIKTTGNVLDLSKPLRFDAGLNTRSASLVWNGKPVLTNETLRTQFIADVQQEPTQTKLSIGRLNVTSSSGLISLKKQGDTPMVVTMATGKLPVGSGALTGTADLARLMAIAMPDADPATRLKRGNAEFTLAFNSDPTKKEYEIRTDAMLSNLDVGDTLKGEQVKLVSRVFTPEDFSRVVAWADVFSSFGNVKLANADVRLTDDKGKPVMPLAMLRSSEFSGNVQSIAKVQALIASMSVPDKSVEPLRVEGGSLTFGGKAGLDEKTGLLAIDFDVPGVTGLKMSRGKATFAPAKPMTMSASVRISSDLAQPDLVKAVRELKVTRLEGDLFGEGRFKMIEPIVITDPSTTPKAKGKIEATARLDFVNDLLETVTGASPIGVLGNVSFTQTLQTDGSAIALVGDASFSKLRPKDPKAQPFPSDRIRIDNDLRVDLVNDTARIGKLRVFTPEGDWLKLEATGSVKQLSTQRVLENVALDLSYDLKQLWPIVRPMLDVDSSKLGQDTVAEGKYTKRFSVTGSFPAVSNGKPLEFNDSVRSLSATGELTIDKFEAPEKGLWMQRANLPIELSRGILTLNGGNSQPIVFNNGEIDIGTVQVDLTKPVPTISIRRNTQLLKNVELNSQLASSYGKFASVLFKDTNKAFGLVNLKVSEFNDVPSDIVSARGDQKGVMELSIDNLHIDGYVTQVIARSLDLGDDGLRGYVRGSMLELKDGSSYSDLVIVLQGKQVERDKDGNRIEIPIELPLRFTGRMDLTSFKLIDTRVELPTHLMKSKELQKFLGKTLIVPIRGSLDKMEFDVAKAIEENVKRGVIPGLLGQLGDKLNKDKSSD